MNDELRARLERYRDEIAAWRETDELGTIIDILDGFEDTVDALLAPPARGEQAPAAIVGELRVTFPPPPPSAEEVEARGILASQRRTFSEAATPPLSPSAITTESGYVVGPLVPVLPAGDAVLSVHRCKVCGTRCDNAPMGDQIEHVRDLPLAVTEARPAPPAGDEVAALRAERDRLRELLTAVYYDRWRAVGDTHEAAQVAAEKSVRAALAGAPPEETR